MSKICSRDLPCLSSIMLCSVVAALLKVICNSKTGNQDRTFRRKFREQVEREMPFSFVFYFRYFKTGSILHNYADVLAILMRLRQLCCHPKLCAAALALSSTESKLVEWKAFVESKCCEWFMWIFCRITVIEFKVRTPKSRHLTYFGHVQNYL